MIADSTEQHEAVIATLICFIRDAEQLAELTADFLDQGDLVPHNDRGEWNPAYLLELGAALRIRRWELSGIKDSIDSTLPTFDAAVAELNDRFQTEPDRFLHGETPLLRRVTQSWWYRCAHPNTHVLKVDVVLSDVERDHLLTCVAQLLWKLRYVEINPINTTD